MRKFDYTFLKKNQRSRRHNEFRDGNGRGTKYRAVIKAE